MRPGPLAVRLDLDVLAGVDLRAAPGAVRQLVRRADAADRARPVGLPPCAALIASAAVAGPVGRRAAADPQADAERRLAPAVVAVAQGRAADVLAGADQRRGPLELLDRQQPQRVPHQHGDAVLAGATLDDALQRRRPSV